ncbi:MAG: hypothetical protein K9L28_03870 [Synergistales bacterium]|nr:hypothetical protein [Synergistales bacterium]
MDFLVAFIVVTVFFAIGDIVSAKTRAFVPSVFVMACLFLAAYWGIIPGIPQDFVETAGLASPLAYMAMYLLLVHMGALMSLKELLAQWRTVVIALSGTVGICALLLTVGALVWGWETMVVATPPLTGGIVAAMIMNGAAEARGLADLAVLAIIMYVIQGFVGYPLTALALKKEGKRLRHIYRTDREKVAELEALMPEENPSGRKGRFQIVPNFPERYQTIFVMLAKMAVIAYIAVLLEKATGGAVSKWVLCLLLGVVFSELGFLERKPMNKAGSFGYLMLGLTAFLFSKLALATPEGLMSIIPALAGSIVLGVSGMALLSMAVGKALGFTREMSFAVALTGLYGFPYNYILTEEAAKALAESPEENKFLMDQMLPKMIVGGFATVTIVSVVLAGFFVKLL